MSGSRAGGGRKAAAVAAKPSSSKPKAGKAGKVTDRGRASDSLVNLAQGVGLGAGNTVSEGRYTTSRLFSRLELESMYRSSWIVGKVVDSVAKDMTRAGIQIQTGCDPKDANKLTTSLTRLGIWRSLLNTVRWGRLYGGAIAFMNIDAQNPATPLRVETIARGQFRGLRVYDRHQLVPDVNNLVQDGMHEGTPMFYSVMSAIDPKAERLCIHHSRVIRLIGHELPPFETIREELWGGPIVERFFDRLLAFDSATMGTANLVDKAYLRTVGIEGLRNILAEDGEAEKDLTRMFALMAVLQRNQGVTLIDAEDEYDAHSYTFAGLDDVLLSFGQQLSGASDIPLVKFFGQAPKGLNATGDSDIRNYYDGVASQQENDLRDGLDTVLRVAHRSILGKPEPEDFDFVFTPLWQLSSKEKAEVANSIATSVQIAVGFGLPLSVALEELQQQAEETGIFTRITDELIKSLEIPPAPAPVAESLATIEAFNAAPIEAGGGETALETVERFTGGSMGTIRRFLGRDGKQQATDFDPDQPRDERGQWTSSGGGAGGTGRFTSSDLQHRDKSGTLKPERAALRAEIRDKTIGDLQPVKDGKPEFLLMGGGPAAGKSTMLKSGAVVLPQNRVDINSDDIKEEIPEYQTLKDAGKLNAAPFVHDESSQIAKDVMDKSFGIGGNVVLDGTGNASLASVMAKTAAARAAGYFVRAEYATSSVESAIERATARAAKTGRAVPESIIRDTHASVSRIFGPAVLEGAFDSANLWDTETKDIVLVASAKGRSLTVHDPERWERFLDKGKK